MKDDARKPALHCRFGLALAALLGLVAWAWAGGAAGQAGGGSGATSGAVRIAHPIRIWRSRRSWRAAEAEVASIRDQLKSILSEALAR